MASFLRDKKQFDEPVVDLQSVRNDDDEYEIPTWYVEYLENFGVQQGNFKAYEFVLTSDLHQLLVEQYIGGEEKMLNGIDN